MEYPNIVNSSGSTYNLSPIPVGFSPQFLLDLTERTNGLLRVDAGREAETLGSIACPFEILARNEWCGIHSLPEILAAFVLPNDKSVQEVLMRTRDLLIEQTGDGSLSGYQTSRSQHVRRMVESLYLALREMRITYINPPASFEQTGQKIRFPEQILKSRMGTCLDLALLFAACIEQCGLHPFVLLIQGHAFSGFWLIDECFPEACIDDAIRFRKRVDVGQICVFESTSITQPQFIDFPTVCRLGRQHLENEVRFLFGIDVRAARKRRILPINTHRGSDILPGPAQSDSQEEICKPEHFHFIPPPVHDSTTQATQIDTDRKTSSLSPGLIEDVPTRIQRWMNKLLDISLRNRLINYRETKKSCPLICRNLPDLEDALSQGKTFKILSRERLPLNDPRDTQAILHRDGAEPVHRFLLEEMPKGRLYADITDNELQRRMIEIYRESRVSLEEGGINTLYLALGFLRWYESESSDIERLAPLILIPISIRRPSIKEGFQMEMMEEEARINVTLLKKLKDDFDLNVTGVDPLPLDESGIHVREIFNRFKDAVLDVDRWEVRETAVIGHFSFMKYLLWYELNSQKDRLLENPVIRHIVERSGGEYSDGISFPDPNCLDDEYPPERVFCVMDADSSQLSAVMAAERGKTFVLQGPPGTGKSQTIANIVAQCLTCGKRVLFVSAKMAALNVVHDRLKKSGLAPFCLELHSNKTEKRKVLDQLKEALDFHPNDHPGNWDSDTDNLGRVRQELNGYAAVLSKSLPGGETPFRVISQLVGYRRYPKIALSLNSPEHFAREFRQQLEDVVERLTSAAQDAGSIRDHPWRASHVETWDPSLQERTIDKARLLLDSISQVEEELSVISSELPVTVTGISRGQFETVSSLVRLLIQFHAPTSDLLRIPDWNSARRNIELWIETGRRRNENRQKVLAQFSQAIWGLDLNQIHDWILRSLRRIPPISWYYLWKCRRRLKGIALTQQLPQRGDLLKLVESALVVTQAERELEQASDQASTWLGAVWQGNDSDWSEIEATVEWTASFRETLGAMSAEYPDANGDKWIQLVTESRGRFQENSPLGRRLRSIAGHLNEQAELMSDLRGLLNLDEDQAWGEQDESSFLDRIKETLNDWIEHPGKFFHWCGYIKARNDARRRELGHLVDSLESGEIGPKELLNVFRHSYYDSYWRFLWNQEPLLREFNSSEHSRKLARFKEFDKKVIKSANVKVIESLTGRIPDAAQAHRNSAVGILTHEILRQRGHRPIRKLLRDTASVVSRIKPCFLMSPLSVAQYLDLEFPPFDLVIFDEASQLPVWETIGTIARAKQAIVVGDSRQLPPTNFFEKMDAADDVFDADDEIEDLESILDESVASGLPEYSLRWHYRSRHEDLIAFSNYHYYDNKLITFPSASEKVPDLGVRLEYLPDAIYDRAESRTNRGEAEKVVDEVVRRLTDPEQQKYSIGIVTLNLAQQILIEELLDNARRHDPAIDRFFSPDEWEPVIVKNLENIQGDERDIIFLCITYGPDQRGIVSMNFGPINRNGGERRLNVAVTRARRQVIVFSSLRADQIDLSRTRAVGAQHLKTYLDYAERGPRAIAEIISPPGAETESPLEQDIYDELVRRGWQVDKQVGCSGYRIDLAVRHPDYPGKYVLGVECDGATYHSSRVARDRDRLREQVLCDLGWKLHRVWSSDWWRDKDGEVEKIERAINQASNQGPHNSPPTNPVSPPEVSQNPVTVQNPVVVNPIQSSSSRLPGERPYCPYLVSGGGICRRESFYLPSTDASIQEKIALIVSTEGPVLFDRVAKTIAQMWGMNHAGSRIRERVLRLIPHNNVRVVVDRGHRFLWPADCLEESYEGFRTPGDGEEPIRKLDEIPTKEIANAAQAVLQNQIEIPLSDLTSEVARCFGFQRISQSMQEEIEPAVRRLAEKGLCQIGDDERVRLV